MKNIIYITLLLSFISCNPLEKKNEEKPLLTNGAYEICINNKISNLSLQILMVINDSSFNQVSTVFQDLNCAIGREQVHEVATGELKRVGYEATVTFKSHYIIALTEWGSTELSGRALCRINWWGVNVAHNTTGKVCDGTQIRENMISTFRISTTGGKLTLARNGAKTTYLSLNAIGYESQPEILKEGNYFYYDGEFAYFIEFMAGEKYRVSSYNVIKRKKITESGNLIVIDNKVSFQRTSLEDPCGVGDEITEHLFKQTRGTFGMRNTSEVGEEMDILFSKTFLDSPSTFEGIVLNKTFTEGCPF